MAFNPEPKKQAVELLFSHKIKSINLFQWWSSNLGFWPQTLGLVLDSKLSFSAHVNEKITKARQSIGMLKFLSYLSSKTFDQIYKLFVHSQFDYCDVIYRIPPFTNPFDSSITLHRLMEAIERIQYQAVLIITGSWKGTSSNKWYEELGWETLSDT